MKESFGIIVTLWPLKQQRWLSFSLVFFFFISPDPPLIFFNLFFFPLSSRQFPLPSQLTPLTPLYSNPAPRSVDPLPNPAITMWSLNLTCRADSLSPVSCTAAQTHQQTWTWHWQERQKSQISSAVVTVASSLHLADHSLQGRGPAVIWHSVSSPSGPVCQLLKTQFQVVLEQGGAYDSKMCSVWNT